MAKIDWSQPVEWVNSTGTVHEVTQAIDDGIGRYSIECQTKFGLVFSDTEGNLAGENCGYIRNVDFQAILDCYRSGQMSEAQWEKHKQDDRFMSWLFRANITPRDEVQSVQHPVKTLRDEFAMAALATIYAEIDNMEYMAVEAYRLADAMMKERAK